MILKNDNKEHILDIKQGNALNWWNTEIMPKYYTRQLKDKIEIQYECDRTVFFDSTDNKKI